MEIGQQAKLIQPVIAGTITDTRYNKDEKQVEHLVEYTDADGEQQARWFLESQLEAA